MGHDGSMNQLPAGGPCCGKFQSPDMAKLDTWSVGNQVPILFRWINVKRPDGAPYFVWCIYIYISNDLDYRFFFLCP